MAFETFNLGEILGQAEAIKGARNRNALAALEQDWLRGQQGVMDDPNATPEQFARVGRSDVANALVNAQRAGMEQQQFSYEQRVRNTQLLNAAAADVAQDPRAYVRWTDQLEASGIFPKGIDWRSVDPEQMRAGAQQLFDSTSASLAALNGGQGGPKIGAFNPGDYTPESFARFQQSGNAADLRRYVTPAHPAVVQIGNATGLVDKGTGRITMLSTEEAERDAARGKAGATATGKTEAERFSAYVDEGVRAADGLPIINRSLELLGSVKTGGIHAAQLAASNFLGVTGADEAELSNNLGKAVLSQLRATFGAQFTEREGARLDALEANFGKSTAGNIRILQQVKQIVERSARRGLDAAERSGDEFSANEIRRSLDMKLSPGNQSASQPGADLKPGMVEDGYRYKGGDKSKPTSWVKVTK